MPWFMVDDAITTDEKVLALAPDIRAEALGTWVLCGAWSSQRLKDGSVPSAIVTAMGGTERGAEALVSVGMWKRTRTGYKFHNWAKYQRTKAQVVAKREDEAERKRKYREQKAQVSGGNVPHLSQRDTSDVPPVSASPIPSHPIPSQPIPNTGSSWGGNSPEQGARFAPQECGREHDPADPCGACGAARRRQKGAERAEADRIKAEAKAKADRNREIERAEREARKAEEAATLAEIEAWEKANR